MIKGIALICSGVFAANAPQYWDKLHKYINPSEKEIIDNSLNKSDDSIGKESTKEGTPSEEATSVGSSSEGTSSGTSSGSSSTEDICKAIERTNLNTLVPEVMFFTTESANCRSHLATMEACLKPKCPVGYLRKIKNILDSATKSMDICIYILTCSVLRKAILAAQKRGVKVRIITDSSTLFRAETNYEAYILQDIELRIKYNSVLMHHKFAVIDSCILITDNIKMSLKICGLHLEKKIK
ncbi:mitochondrial cardiolipin hydrolase isoform X2 [Harpegnathos saltator]|uniref:mitochondrial cardiolipin hydrolase isoform X2 n=1 Tax=Harpegnathos saltator TaxID=610380 RepID=UPI00058DAF6B|nr:mitochondrial cardiolipin hydrolase isoform X2 [Harpegnathos saltator]